MVLGLQPVTVRDVNGGPMLDFYAGEEVVRVELGASVALGRRIPECPGSLFITTRRVVWLSDVDKEKGYMVDFVAISLHAVSRDPEAYPVPCIYTQIEREDDEDEESEESRSEANEELDLSKVTEMRIMPSDPTLLDTLFEVFCQCAELNPDPNAESEEENSWICADEEMGDGGDQEWQTSDTLANPIGQNGEHGLAHSVLELQIDDQRFEDAEEEAEHKSFHGNGH